MSAIVFIEKKTPYNDWKCEESSMGLKKPIESVYVIKSDTDSSFGVSAPTEIIELILSKEIPPSPSTIAIHQGLSEGMEQDLEKAILEKWPNVKLFEYSIGLKYVVEFGKTGEKHKPTVYEGKDEYTIKTILENAKYSLIPKLFETAESEITEAERQDKISNLQLCINAMSIYLETANVVSRAGESFASALTDFFASIPEKYKGVNALDMETLEQRFQNFVKERNILLTPEKVNKAIDGCRQIIDLLEQNKISGASELE